MTRKPTIVAPLPLALIWALAGCSGGCSDGGAGLLDAGDAGSGDADADSDTDSDTSTGDDTDQHLDTDACDPENAVFTHGPWEWEDLPEGIDCGPGCAQLTFSDQVFDYQWDVWDDLLVYKDSASGYIHVVDITGRRQFTVPNIYPQIEIGKKGKAVMTWPAVRERQVFYSYVTVSNSSPDHPHPMGLLVGLDLDARTQTILSARRRTDGGGGSYPAQKFDVHGDRLVGWNGCGGFQTTLCVFDTTQTCGQGQVLMEGGATSIISLWNDRFAYNRTNPETATWDIMLHDFGEGQATPITDEFFQSSARIHGSRVVYVDFRHSLYGVEGPWEHAAVFHYDLDEEQETQLTSAEWIASHPDVFGDLVIWADYRFSANPNNKNSAYGVEIFGLNLATQVTAQVSHFPNRKAFPRLWGDRAFVQMFYAPGKFGIFSFDIPEELR